MREVDPIRNPSEALLSAALHRLASGSPQNAPAELGANLAREFRRRHQRRRRARTAVVTALAACLALVAALVAAHKPTGRKSPPLVARQQVRASTATPVPEAHAEHATQAGHARPGNAPASADDNGFLPLDAYDPATTPGDLQVVRLEVSGSDLRMIGAPVAEDMSDRLLLADIVVGEDGTPYAVRIVR